MYFAAGRRTRLPFILPLLRARAATYIGQQRMADEALASSAFVSDGGAATRSAPVSGSKCPVPMWKANDFVCEGWDAVGAELFWKDMSGDLRASYGHGMKCPVRCPSGAWFQHPDISELTCFHGEWVATADFHGDIERRQIRGINCNTSPVAKMALVGILFTKVVLCLVGGALASKKGGVDISRVKLCLAGGRKGGGASDSGDPDVARDVVRSPSSRSSVASASASPYTDRS
mmetsp:Transcript_54941/g.154113  ORF Transcript_54941/g.154113 Transcript_54941/m.154113 type:complete len:232 (+) Transcript_54941:75-770(+)